MAPSLPGLTSLVSAGFSWEHFPVKHSPAKALLQKNQTWDIPWLEVPEPEFKFRFNTSLCKLPQKEHHPGRNDDNNVTANLQIERRKT